MGKRLPNVAGVRVDHLGHSEYEVFDTPPRWWWPFGSIYAHGRRDDGAVLRYRRRLVPWWGFRRERRAAYRFVIEWSRIRTHRKGVGNA